MLNLNSNADYRQEKQKMYCLIRKNGNSMKVERCLQTERCEQMYHCLEINVRGKSNADY